MAFAEGSIADEKVYGGVVFPKTLLPPSTLKSPSTDDLVKLLEQERAWLSGVLQEHGSILLRGFNIASAQDFSRVVVATGWPEFVYRGAGMRKNPAHRVFTVNESPIHIPIGFHHEMGLIKEHPAKVIFFCEQPSPEGGQTSIVRSDVVVEKMEEALPHVVERLQRGGIHFVHHRKRETWQQMTGSDDPVEAEKSAVEKLLGCNSVKFNDDGTADFHYGPLIPIKEIDGKRVMFNTIVGYVTEQVPLNATYDDGTLIPQEILEVYEKILEENSVDIQWQKGDILLINNFKVQHSRRSGKPPRVVFVSLPNY